MANILDYLWEVTADFSQIPFSDVDSLVLSQLSYLLFDGLVPGPGDGSVPLESLREERLLQSLTRGTRVPEQNRELLIRLCENPRYHGLSLSGYVNVVDQEAQEQFSAVTFLFPSFAYVAFRGTDSTYVAWKEDFNLAFISPVPAQVSAVGYLDRAASLTPLPLRVGGHSKGGNLAVYASAFCAEKTADRLLAVYSHDGPGFTREILDSPEFARILDRVRKTMPQSSLVGVLLQHQENYQVIQSDGFWILQHDPFSWLVEKGDFLHRKDLTPQARLLDKGLNAWISSLTKEELSRFADALYQVLCALPGDSFSDMPDNWWETVPETLKGLKDLDRDTYACILRTVGTLVPQVVKSAPRPPWLPELPLPQKLLQSLRNR